MSSLGCANAFAHTLINCASSSSSFANSNRRKNVLRSSFAKALRFSSVWSDSGRQARDPDLSAGGSVAAGRARRGRFSRRRTSVRITEYLVSVYVSRVIRSTATEIRDVVLARTPTHSRLRDRLVGIALVTIGVDVLCAVLALVFEHDAKQTQIKSFGSALFWTSTQLLTVSSSLQNPISTPARLLDVAMEIYAVTVVATLAGARGAFLVKRVSEIDQAAERTKNAAEHHRVAETTAG